MERVPVKEKADDHRGAVAKRVYAIRNRIVHTKGTYGDEKPLFPFDPKVKYLRHDIRLDEIFGTQGPHSVHPPLSRLKPQEDHAASLTFSGSASR